MNQSPPSTLRRPTRSWLRTCLTAYGLLASGWVLGLVVVSLVLVQLRSTEQVSSTIWSEAMVIAVASGIIGVIAMLPSLLSLRGIKHQTGQSSRSQRGLAEHWTSIAAAVLAGTGIRMIGTVALILTCRYQMASTTEMIVAMTIGWYLLMTTIEVIALGRLLPAHARSLGHLFATEPLKV